MSEEYTRMKANQHEQGLIRVVVVDDHQVVREGLRMMLEILGEGFVMVGEAADGASALRVVKEAQPDVVLMDLRMPGMDGLEAITHLRAQWPHIAIVILTTYNEDDLMLRGLRAGACGYLLKDTSSETMFQAIRSAARGETLLQPGIVARLLSHASQEQRPSPRARRSGEGELSERELEVLRRVASGERSKEIAAQLGISLRTVGAHLTSIYTKLGVDSRTSAVAVALERGLLSR
ncbi:transcriptional regulatory protein YdfI [Ktedonobacter sp. SOSP1-85]|uniref:response regulator n=1 Tax=Ktedonobacter sp. SOSP1-85 TaxID=2778367 RepID=UPI00191504B8|nr:response regulator transcription factor [Ktedonobacter sp. SOSP1-85]GHO78678.1 transcriptional regulatory protein YdfI [Ktedonobacter sp. SOSP1-85]